VNNLELDFDVQMVKLESEWRQVYEDSINARADYQSLAASRVANLDLLDAARERLEKTEALKSRTMAKIERLEHKMLGYD
jgi:hypothetical protein